jgi:O-antigen/teichoic acid export membrane protein
MKKHLTNAGYGVLDYISYPLGMLLVAPVVLHELGAAEYGLWMISTAVISAGSIVASGFCDACIQRVAYLRGTDELHLAPAAVRSAMGINLALGVLFAACAWIAAPFVASHVAVSNLIPRSECLVVLRIASVAILVRTVESVAVGVQRAFEQYRSIVQISTLMRFFTLAAAALLALLGQRTISILLATLVFLALGAFAQFRALRKLIAGVSFWPQFHPAEARHLFRQGFFVWLQTLGGVVFGQLDRILLGISLGALAVTPYSLCVQFAHPIYGLSASGFNFLFPYLSSRAGAAPRHDMKRVVGKAFLCNLLIVVCSAALLLLFGRSLIRIWAGPAVAESAKSILPPIVIGAALMGLSVTGTYALQALGEFRSVAFIMLAGRSAMLLLMIWMLRHNGLQGLAVSRLFYGAVALVVYLPLLRILSQKLKSGQPAPRRVSPPAISALAMQIEAQETSQP